MRASASSSAAMKRTASYPAESTNPPIGALGGSWRFLVRTMHNGRFGACIFAVLRGHI